MAQPCPFKLCPLTRGDYCLPDASQLDRLHHEKRKKFDPSSLQCIFQAPTDDDSLERIAKFILAIDSLGTKSLPDSSETSAKEAPKPSQYAALIAQHQITAKNFCLFYDTTTHAVYAALYRTNLKGVIMENSVCICNKQILSCLWSVPKNAYTLGNWNVSTNLPLLPTKLLNIDNPSSSSSSTKTKSRGVTRTTQSNNNNDDDDDVAKIASGLLDEHQHVTQKQLASNSYKSYLEFLKKFNGNADAYLTNDTNQCVGEGGMLPGRAFHNSITETHHNSSTADRNMVRVMFAYNDHTTDVLSYILRHSNATRSGDTNNDGNMDTTPIVVDESFHSSPLANMKPSNNKIAANGTDTTIMIPRPRVRVVAPKSTNDKPMIDVSDDNIFASLLDMGWFEKQLRSTALNDVPGAAGVDDTTTNALVWCEAGKRLGRIPEENADTAAKQMHAALSRASDLALGRGEYAPGAKYTITCQKTTLHQIMTLTAAGQDTLVMKIIAPLLLLGAMPMLRRILPLLLEHVTKQCTATFVMPMEQLRAEAKHNAAILHGLQTQCSEVHSLLVSLVPDSATARDSLMDACEAVKNAMQTRAATTKEVNLFEQPCDEDAF